MTTNLTQAQLNLIRSHSQRHDLYLAVIEPDILFRATLSGTYDREVLELYPNGALTGSINNLADGMSLYIGSSAGAEDLGRVRFKGVTNNIISIAVDYEKNYKSGLYVEGRRFFEFWPVFGRAELDEEALTTTFYKDWDVPYSDQNTNLYPTVIMGPDYANFITSTGTTVYFTATGSYTSDGTTITTYAWDIPTGTVTNIVGNVGGGYVWFPNAGDYTVGVTVTNNNSKTQKSYRNVLLRNRFGKSTNKLCIKDWNLSDLTGDINGGWVAKFEVGADAHKFKDGYLVILFSEDAYNGQAQSISGFLDREHILFIGYVSAADSKYDWQESKSTIIVKGLSGMMSNREMFSVTLSYAPVPTDWTEIANPELGVIYDHYLRWHSTIHKMADVARILPVTYGEKYQNVSDFPKGDIYSIIGDYLGKRIFANVISDKTGRLFADVDPNMIVTGSRPATLYTLQKGDWIDKVNFIEVMEKPVSNILLGGVQFDLGNSVTGTAYLSRAPGEWPGYFGKSQNISGVNCDGQNDLNNLSGLLYARENVRVAQLEVELSGEMRNIDITQPNFLKFDLSTDDTYRRQNWTNKRFMPIRIIYKYKDGLLTQQVTFREETYGPPGSTIIIPTDPTRARTRRPRTPVRPSPPPGSTIPMPGEFVYVVIDNG